MLAGLGWTGHVVGCDGRLMSRCVGSYHLPTWWNWDRLCHRLVVRAWWRESFVYMVWKTWKTWKSRGKQWAVSCPYVWHVSSVTSPQSDMEKMIQRCQQGSLRRVPIGKTAVCVCVCLIATDWELLQVSARQYMEGHLSQTLGEYSSVCPEGKYQQCALKGSNKRN